MANNTGVTFSLLFSIYKKSVFGRNMCDLFITIISRLKLLTFLNEKKNGKKKKKREKNPVL